MVYVGRAAWTHHLVPAGCLHSLNHGWLTHRWRHLLLLEQKQLLLQVRVLLLRQGLMGRRQRTGLVGRVVEGASLTQGRLLHLLGERGLLLLLGDHLSKKLGGGVVLGR